MNSKSLVNCLSEINISKTNYGGGGGGGDNYTISLCTYLALVIIQC